MTQACRTSRDTVEVMDAEAPPRRPSDDYLHIDKSLKTTFSLTAISLPAMKIDSYQLDLTLKSLETPNDAYSKKAYKIGESIPIEAYRDYEIILSAYAADTEIYSTRFCSLRQTFRAEQGMNAFTASLCTKPFMP
jgi:hypothetical protein